MDTVATGLNNTIELTDFKARCLEVLEHLVAPGLIVMNEGRPLAHITPLAVVNNEPLIGSMKGQIAILGDIFSTGVEWDAQS